MTLVKDIDAKAIKLFDDYDLTTDADKTIKFYPDESVKTLYIQAEYTTTVGTGVDIEVFTSASDVFTSKSDLSTTSNALDWDNGDGAAITVEDCIDVSGKYFEYINITTAKDTLTSGTLNLWIKPGFD